MSIEEVSENSGPFAVELSGDYLDQQPRVVNATRRLGELWDRRPDLLELHFYYLPLALAAASFAIGVVDKQFHLHLAIDMANVHAGAHTNVFERSFDGAIHDIGAAAVQAEK